MSKDQAALLRALVEKKGSKTVEKIKEEIGKPTLMWENECPQLIKSKDSTESCQTKSETVAVAPTDFVIQKPLQILLKSSSTEKEALNSKNEIEPVCLKDSLEDALITEGEKVSTVVKNCEESHALEESIKESLETSVGGVRTIAVCSGKGGVGKTSLVLNTAIALSRQGKRPLILDTDYGFTNIDILCGIAIPYTLQDVLKGEKLLTEVIVEGPEGVRIISGGNDISRLSEFEDSHQMLFKEQFSALEDIDVLLIDMGAGVSTLSLMYLSFAQEILLVTTPEATSIMDAYSLLKIMDLACIRKPIHTIINRVKDESEAERTFKKINLMVTEYLNLTLNYLTFVREDKIVSQSAKFQVPFLLEDKDSLPSKDVMQLTKVLFEIEPTKRFKNMKDVVGRLFHMFNRS